MGPRVRQAWVRSHLLICSLGTLGKLLDLSEPQFPLWMTRTVITCPENTLDDDQIKVKSREGSFISEDVL